jgi:hypothetical protein
MLNGESGNMKNKKMIETMANEIVNLILEDMQNRCGLGNAWDEIDPTMRVQIAEIWRQIAIEEIHAHLNRNSVLNYQG